MQVEGVGAAQCYLIITVLQGVLIRVCNRMLKRSFFSFFLFRVSLSLCRGVKLYYDQFELTNEIYQ